MTGEECRQCLQCEQGAAVGAEFPKGSCLNLLVIQVVPVYYCSSEQGVFGTLNRFVLAAGTCSRKHRVYHRVLDKTKAFGFAVWNLEITPKQKYCIKNKKECNELNM